MSLDWLIIGGGIHGVHIAARLIGEADVDPQQLRIVDPSERLLERWKTCTATTGMTHLRSTVVHHLDTSPQALRVYANKHHKGRRGLFAPPYNRPALELFNAHCDHVLQAFGLTDLHIEARAVACAFDCDRVGVRLKNGAALEARNVVLAVGVSDQPFWPEWALRDHRRIHHIFDPEFAGWPSAAERVAVVGGGISACQVALRLHGEGHQVHLVSRHPLRQHQFDSDPGWLGPKHMTRFNRVRDPNRRRALIAEARHRGSVPPDVLRAFKRALRDERLGWTHAEVDRLTAWTDGVSLRLSTGVALDVDRVLLATGFTPRRPGGAMVDDLAASASLPCARCGYPVVDSQLRWHPQIYVSGPLAELELGPSARNIAGARRAGDRIVQAARGQTSARPQPVTAP